MSGDGSENSVPGSVIVDACMPEMPAPTSTRFEFVPAFDGLDFVAMAQTARSLGYALGLHGFMQRDLDVIAVPWTEDAVSAERLVEVLAERHGRLPIQAGGPVVKPHGRLGYNIMLGGHFYVDLSVMPRRSNEEKR